jgi:hypothetical protein
MTKSAIRIIIILAIITFFVGCTTAPQLTPWQKREITTRLMNSDYDNTYRATLTVLQDQGYIIKNTDMTTGLINATIDRETAGGSQVIQAIFIGYVSDKGSEIDASFMINAISDTQTEVRLNLQEAKYGQSSKWSGTGKTNVKQILDPEIFSNLFNAIQVEIKRREAMNP